MLQRRWAISEEGNMRLTSLWQSLLETLKEVVPAKQEQLKKLVSRVFRLFVARLKVSSRRKLSMANSDRQRDGEPIMMPVSETKNKLCSRWKMLLVG